MNIVNAGLDSEFSSPKSIPVKYRPSQMFDHNRFDIFGGIAKRSTDETS